MVLGLVKKVSLLLGALGQLGLLDENTSDSPLDVDVVELSDPEKKKMKPKS